MRPRFRNLLMLFSPVLAGAIFWIWLRSYGISTAEIRSAWNGLAWWPIPAIFLLLWLHIGLSALRWARIEMALGGEQPQLDHACITSGLALGLGVFLPGPIANVVCRGTANRLVGASGLRGAMGGGLDQIADFAMVCFVAPAALLAIYLDSLGAYLLGCAILALAGDLAVGRMGRVKPRSTWNWLVARLPRQAMSGAASLAPKAARELYRLSFARFVCLNLITLLIHYASGAATALGALVAVPLVTIANSVAMFPGSFGVSEWSFSGVLSLLAIPNAEIATFVLTNRLILTVLALVIAGLATVWAMAKSRARRQAAR